jgi:hypothetical protein
MIKLLSLVCVCEYIIVGDSSMKGSFSVRVVSRKVAHLPNARKEVFEGVYDVEQFLEGNVQDPLQLAFTVHPVGVYDFVEKGGVGLKDVFIQPFITSHHFQFYFLEGFVQFGTMQE